MAYFAGMIWSVSMLWPNFHALPRTTLGNVTCASPRRPRSTSAVTARPGVGVSVAGAGPPCAFSCDPCRHLLEQLSRMGDHTGPGDRRRRRGVGKVDHRLGVAHAAREIPVRGAQADLSLTEHAHVPAQTRAAGCGRPRGSAGEEDADQPFFLRLHRDLVR